MEMRRKHNRGYRIFNIVSKILLGLFSLICLLPFVLMIVGSFTDNGEVIREGYSLFPKQWSTAAYDMLFSYPDNIIRAYRNTIIQTVLGTAISLFCISGTGYVLSRQDFQSRNIIAFFFYSMLQTQIEVYSEILQVIGGLFVVIVGVYIFFQNPVPQIRKNRAGKTNVWQDYSSMFVFTLANFVVVIPYLLAFFAMFNVGLQTGGDMASLLRSSMTILGFFAGAVAWWVGLTLTIDYFRRRFRPRHMLTINHVAGVIIGVLGVYTIISTFFDILPK